VSSGFDDFTEDEYRRLLSMARDHWRFITCDEAFGDVSNVVLWRHDVDFSPQRALRLAAIEAEAGVRATYFILLTSNFYNALESSVANAIRGICERGHALGLHFDPGLRGRSAANGISMAESLTFDRRILEEYFGVPVAAFSYHNPTTVNGALPDVDTIAGMVNTYGPTIRERFSYVSDSNGLWRHRRLAEVLEEVGDSRLPVLTHPEGWTPEPMSPRDRVTRCIEGRSRRQHADYDELLERYQRPNIR